MVKQDSGLLRFGPAGIGVILLLLTFVSSAVAEGPQVSKEEPQAKPAAATEKEKVTTGVIAGTSAYGGGNRSIDIETDGASPGDEANVISGSVSVTGRRECTVSVINKSEKNGYRVRFRVRGVNERGARTLNKPFSATLSVKETFTRKLTCDGQDNLTVELLSAKKIGK